MMIVNHGFFAMKLDREPQRVIWAFRGEFQFLSNFTLCRVCLPAEGDLSAMVFDSTEKAFVAWRTLDQGYRARVLQQPTPGDAKKLGQCVDFPLRPDWTEKGELALMLALLRQKFGVNNPDLRAKLLETGNAVLIEGNDWGDHFYGFSFNEGWGWNHLGRLLMQVRQEIALEG